MKNICYLFFVLLLSCASEKAQKEFKYTPFSKSVIHLMVKKSLSDTILVHADAITIIPRGRSRSNLLSIKDKGNYYLMIDIDRPAKANLYIDNDGYNIMLFPSDTSHIELNSNQADLNISFYGHGKTINEYFFEKKEFLGHTDLIDLFQEIISSNSDYNSIKIATDSITDRELTFLRKYKSSNSLPKWFFDNETAEIVYSGAGFKLTRPGRNKRVKLFEDILPDDYFNFLDDIEIDNPNAIYSSVYFLFLDYYFRKDLPTDELSKLPRLSRLKKYNSLIIDQSKNQLLGLSKEIFHKRFFSSVFSNYSNKSDIDSLANALQLSDYSDLIFVNTGDVIKDFELKNEYDSIFSFRNFEDKIIYINFWATWCGPCIKRFSELNNLIFEYADNPRIEFVNICLDSEKDKWASIIKNHNVNGINLIAEGSMSTQLKTYFSIQGVPQYVLLGKNNMLLEKSTLKASEVNSKIERLLENTITQ